ncbi:unnamed protein product [Oikopleura dioica]|uniref:protein-serine/threonine phosphatase n=1 Tax=Oikopleura dioica TaxID=34765 RepID=E4XYA9_OIKDI|nr:unnamed protein product [Oikopleura dioica]
MEDADLCVPKLPTPLEDWSLYAVFDGHGGDETAKKAAEKVPDDERETRRITDAGLKVRDGRIQGNLAVARAFGDFQYKRAKDKEQLEQPVSCLPDVHFFERSSDDEYIVMACDGVYDVLSNDELVVLVRSKFAQSESIVDTVEEIVDVCLNRGSIDNMTIILIAFETVFNKDIDAVECDTEPIVDST